MNKGQFIKEERLRQGMTQEDLAAKTEISTRTIQRIENGDVEARAYTLQSIATALEIEFEVLNNITEPIQDIDTVDNERIWLPLLHLSGLFNLLLPPLIIWLVKRDSIKKMSEHGIAVLNFQLSMLLYEVCGILVMFIIPIMVLMVLILFSLAMVIVNTIKVSNGQPYKYPLSIKILKPQL